jgi:hypothetical protein
MNAFKLSISRIRFLASSSSTAPILPAGELSSLAMAQTLGTAGALVWSKVDVLTAYQRLTAEMQIRVRMRETMNDSEPFFHMKNISAEPLLPGAVPLNGVPEGLFNKGLVGGIRTFEVEPPPPDQMEVTRRYAMFQAGSFMITGAAEFPKALEPKMHGEMLLKNRFFPLVDVTVTVIGVAGKTWSQPTIWLNRDHMLALYLG